MGHEFISKNWTMFPNDILDNVNNLTPAECKILMIMVRQTMGWVSNVNYRFSLRWLVEKTGMSKQTVITAIHNLLKKGSITLMNPNAKHGYEYQIIWKAPLEWTKKYEDIENDELKISSQNEDNGLKIRPETPNQRSKNSTNIYKQKNINKKPEDKKLSPEELFPKVTPEMFNVAFYLYKLHRDKCDPKFKIPNKLKLFKEADIIRLMIEKDDRTVEEIHEVITIVKNDEFWRKNILSVKKLRLQFTRFVDQTKIANIKSNPEMSSRCPDCDTMCSISGSGTYYCRKCDKSFSVA